MLMLRVIYTHPLFLTSDGTQCGLSAVREQGETLVQIARGLLKSDALVIVRLPSGAAAA